MTQQIVLKTPTETLTVCTTCKHFSEVEGLFLCRFFSAFLSAETLCIPCDFEEKNDFPDNNMFFLLANYDFLNNPL